MADIDLIIERIRGGLVPLDFTMFLKLIENKLNIELNTALNDFPFLVNVKNSSGETLFMKSIILENFEASRILFEYGCKINPEFQNNSEVKKILISMKNISKTVRMVYTRKTLNFSMLAEIIENGRNDALDFAPSSSLDLIDSKGTTLLMKSAEFGNLEAVRLLINKGLNIEEADSKGFTALHYAVLKNSREIIELLLDRGANVNRAAIRFITPFSLAVEEGSCLIDLMLKREINFTIPSRRMFRKILIKSVQLNQDKLVAKLLEQDHAFCRINGEDNYGKTSLIYAAQNGNEEIVRMLLNRNASTYKRDKRGQNAYFIAALHGHTHIIRLLIDSGYVEELINLTDEFGLDYPNALFAAIQRERYDGELMKILIDGTPDGMLEHTDLEGNSILHKAVDLNEFNITEELMKRNINVDIVNLNNETALDIAVKNNNGIIACLLVDGKSEVSRLPYLLKNQISERNTKNIIALIKCGFPVNHGDILEAVTFVPANKLHGYKFNDLNFGDSLWNDILGILLRGDLEKMDLETAIFLALKFAIRKNNLRTIHQICDAGYTYILDAFKGDLLIGKFVLRDVYLFLKQFIKFTENVRLYFKNETDETVSLSTYPLSKFIYKLMTWRIKKYNINDILYNGQTLADAAIENNRADITIILLKYGKQLHLKHPELFSKYENYNVNTADENNTTAFDIALIKKNLEVIELLVSETEDKEWARMKLIYGPHVRIAQDMEYKNPLFSIIKRESCDELKTIMRNDSMSALQIYYSENWNAVHYAISLGNLEIIRILSDFVQNITTLDGLLDNRKIAKIFNHSHLVDFSSNHEHLFLNETVDVNVILSNIEDSNSLSLANILYKYFKGKAGTENIINVSYNDETALQRAIRCKQEEFATVLIQHGAKPHLENDYELSLQQNFSPEFVKLYYESKSVGMKTLKEAARIAIRRDITIFNKAWNNKDLRSILQFKSKVYDITEPDKNNETVFDIAMLEKNAEIIKILIIEVTDEEWIRQRLIYGPRVCISKDMRYSNPLFDAIRQENIAELKTIIEMNPLSDVRFYGKENWNALHYAISLGKLEVIKVFPAISDNLSTLDRLLTYVETAKLFQHFEVVEYISKSEGFDLKKTPYVDQLFLAFHGIETRKFALGMYIFILSKVYMDNIVNTKYEKETALQRAIRFKNEKFATVLLQHGATLDSAPTGESLVGFSADFLRLYYESKSGGMKTLEEEARIATRQDVATFNEAWKNEYIRSMLEFKSKTYDITKVDENNETALDIAMKDKNVEAVRLIMSETDDLEWARNKLIYGPNFPITKEMTYSNPLFSAIKQGNIDGIKRFVKREPISLHRFYGMERWNAFHYANSIGNQGLLKLLVELGTLYYWPNCLALEFTFIAQLFGHTNDNNNLFNRRKCSNHTAQFANYMSTEELQYISFSDFLCKFFKHKAMSDNVDILIFNEENALQAAIDHGREDVATVLLQHGATPNCTLGENCSEQFKQLYDESKGAGDVTLKQLARNAARKDPMKFNQTLMDRELGKLLKYQSKVYDVNYADETGRTVLDIAIITKDRHAIKQLISEFDDDGLIVKKLIYGPFYAEDLNWSNPLFDAIQNHDIDAVKTTIETEEIDLNQFYGKERWNALHFAISTGNMKIIELLLTRGSKSYSTKDKIFSCFQLADIFGHHHVADHLIELPSLEFNQEPSLMRISPEELQHIPFDEFLYRFFNNMSIEGNINNIISDEEPLRAAVKCRREDIATVLLQHGVTPLLEKSDENLLEDFSSQFKNLYYAIKNDEYSTLLSDNYSSNLMALDFAMKEENKTVMKWIVSHTEDKEMIIKKLVYGPGVNIDRGMEWSNPLFSAIKDKNVDGVRSLIRGDILRNEDIFYGRERWIALHYAISLGDMNVIKWFLDNGSLLLKTGDKLFSCVELADLFGHDQVVDYLSALPESEIDKNYY